MTWPIIKDCSPSPVSSARNCRAGRSRVVCRQGTCFGATDFGAGGKRDYREIEHSLGTSAPTVSKWKARFEQLGMEALQGRHQGSKPRRATHAVQGCVIRRAQQKPFDS